jgi:transposase
MASNKLTQAQRRQIKKDYDNDMPVREIARKFGISAATVTYWAKKAVPSRSAPAPSKRKRRPQTKDKLTPAQRLDVAERYRKGEPMKDIAERYGIKMSTINYWIRKHGVPRRTNNAKAGSMQTIDGPRPRKCLRCGKSFKPYSFGGQINRYICFDCWMLSREVEAQPSNPIGRRV